MKNNTIYLSIFLSHTFYLLVKKTLLVSYVNICRYNYIKNSKSKCVFYNQATATKCAFFYRETPISY